MKNHVLWLMALLLLTACGGSQRPLPTQADLLRQDSLERVARTQHGGRKYGLPEERLLSALPLQALPVTYMEGFEYVLPGFEDVSPTMVMPLFGLEGLTKTKAIRLPDKEGTHVFLVGGRTEAGMPEVWMVTLDGKTWSPIDALSVYEETSPDEESAEAFTDEEDLGTTRVEFSVTSRYEIYIQVVFLSYVDDQRELTGVSVYSIGRDGKFFELEKNRLNHGATDDTSND